MDYNPGQQPASASAFVETTVLMRRALILAAFLVTGAFPGACHLEAAPPFPGAAAFVQKNCVACHNSPTGAGRLDLTKLGYEPANTDNFAMWVKVDDRVAAGEMPPAGIPRPPVESSTQFVKRLATVLAGYERSVYAERGRAGLRRLNSYEYENAIRDLLGVPWVQIRSKLPQDGEAYRYNKI